MVLIYKFLQTPFTKKNPMKILLILSITIIDLMKSSIISLTLANRKAYLMFQHEDLLRFFVINNLALIQCMLLYYRHTLTFRARLLIFQAKVRIDGFMQGLTSTIREVSRHFFCGFSF